MDRRSWLKMLAGIAAVPSLAFKEQSKVGIEPHQADIWDSTAKVSVDLSDKLFGSAYACGMIDMCESLSREFKNWGSVDEQYGQLSEDMARMAEDMITLFL